MQVTYDNKQLRVKPVKWDTSIIDGVPFITCVGHSDSGQSVYFRLLQYATIVLRSVGPITTTFLEQVAKNFLLVNMYSCIDNDDILIVRSKTTQIPNGPWSVVAIDPYGPLQSLWETLEVGPYEWLSFSDYRPLAVKSGNCDLNFVTDELRISPAKNVINFKYRVLVLQVFNETINITTVDSRGPLSYVISWACNKQVCNINASSLEQALNKLYGIYSAFQPDLIAYTDIDTLDVVRNLVTRGNSSISKSQLIDLPQYMRRFHDVDIKSLSFHQILLDFEVVADLETTCNNLSVDIDTLLTGSYEDIIDRAAFNIDAAAVLRKTKSPHKRSTFNSVNFKLLLPATYHNIHMYDYTELYLQLMIETEDEITSLLGARLEDAPFELIVAAFYSSYVITPELLTQLQEHLQKLEGVLAVTATHVISKGELGEDWLTNTWLTKDDMRVLIHFSDSSYIKRYVDDIQYNNYDVTYPISRYLVKLYIRCVRHNTMDKFLLPNTSKIPVSKLVAADNTIMTTSGKQQWDQTKDYVVDYNYYNKLLTQQWTTLKNLRIIDGSK